MKIKDLHFASKPSYKLIRKGPEVLEDPELLAIILGKGKKEESALALAHRLIKDYHLRGLEKLSYTQVREVCEGDHVKALRVVSMLELAKRYNRLKDKGYKTIITSAEDVYNHLKDRYGNKKKEYFICLYLDTKNRILKEEVISIGTLNSSLVHPREVFKVAIQESANSVILVHNHPSGDPTPSEEDIELTDLLRETAKFLHIKLVDHVIISSNEYYSFIEKENTS